MSVIVQVVAALIVRDRRLLIAQRPPGKKRAGQWEFPGGKTEPGETPEAALARELSEELGVAAEIGELVEKVAHEYPDLHVEVFFFHCRLADGVEVERREHSRLEWIDPSRLGEFEFVEADRELLPRFAAWAKGLA